MGTTCAVSAHEFKIRISGDVNCRNRNKKHKTCECLELPVHLVAFYVSIMSTHVSLLSLDQINKKEKERKKKTYPFTDAPVDSNLWDGFSATLRNGSEFFEKRASPGKDLAEEGTAWSRWKTRGIVVHIAVETTGEKPESEGRIANGHHS